MRKSALIAYIFYNLHSELNLLRTSARAQDPGPELGGEEAREHPKFLRVRAKAKFHKS